MRAGQGGAVFGIRLVLCAALVGMVAGLAPAARPAEARVVTHAATLHPMRVEQGERSKQHRDGDIDVGDFIPGPQGCLLPHDPVAESVPPVVDPVLVGFWNGREECSSSSVYRARVVFDLSELTRYPLAKGRPIVARLTYREQIEARSDPPPFGSQGVTCVDRLRIASAEDSWHVRDGDLFQISPRNDGHPALKSDPWSVEDAIEGWLNGDFHNFGLVLQGYDEAFSENTNKCRSALSNFELQVAVFWDTPPAPDLQILKLEAADKSGAAGCVSGSVNAVATVRNEGDAGDTFEVLLRVDGQGREAVITSVGPYGDEQVAFPTVDVSAGPHTLETVIDPQGAKEPGPGDRPMTKSLQVTCASGAAPKPAPRPADLQVAEVAVENTTGVARCIVGKDNHVRTEIKNAGDADVGGNFTTQLIVDKQPVATTTVGGVGANSEKRSYLSDVNLTKGTHTIQVKVDPDNEVPEADESNNASEPITVTCGEQGAGPGAGNGDEDDDDAAGRAQERPDLQIEYAGFSPPHLRHTITFKVTNVGKARSSPTKARIFALKPPPENVSEPEVRSLAPGESEVLFYGLSGDGCNGHEVRATVNDPLDLNGTNDHVQRKVC